MAGTKFGAIIGTFVGGALMQKWGRKVALTSVTFFYILGPIVMSVGDTGGMLALGRWLTGIGVGASAVTCPAYTAEMAPASLRGAMVSMCVSSLRGFGTAAKKKASWPRVYLQILWRQRLW